MGCAKTLVVPKCWLEGVWGVKKLPDMKKKIKKNPVNFLTWGQNGTRQWVVEVRPGICHRRHRHARVKFLGLG